MRMLEVSEVREKKRSYRRFERTSWTFQPQRQVGREHYCQGGAKYRGPQRGGDCQRSEVKQPQTRPHRLAWILRRSWQQVRREVRTEVNLEAVMPDCAARGQINPAAFDLAPPGVRENFPLCWIRR